MKSPFWNADAGKRGGNARQNTSLKKSLSFPSTRFAVRNALPPPGDVPNRTVGLSMVSVAALSAADAAALDARLDALEARDAEASGKAAETLFG